MPDDAILTPEEAAAYLKVNPQTVYRNLRRGRLPGAKVGRQWRLRRSDLDRFLAGGASAAGEEALPWPTASKPADSVGSGGKRAALLRAELDRFVRVAVQVLKPLRIILYGSYARGTVGEWSDLDLVVVAATELPFYERSKVILKEVRPKAGMDVLVYTPAEWEELGERPFVRDEIRGRGRIVYER